MDTDEKVTWVRLRDIFQQFNYASYASAKQARTKGTFPVPVRRLGQTLVCDKAAVDKYFEEFRKESLDALAGRTK